VPVSKQGFAFLDNYRSDPQYRIGESYMRAYPACRSLNAARVNACKILGQKEAQDYLAKKGKKAAEAVDLQEEDILRDLIKVKDMCMGTELSPFVKVTKDGDIIEGDASDFNAGGATKALELLGKTKKMFTDKVETQGSMEVEFNFDLVGGNKNAG